MVRKTLACLVLIAAAAAPVVAQPGGGMGRDMDGPREGLRGPRGPQGPGRAGEEVAPPRRLERAPAPAEGFRSPPRGDRRGDDRPRMERRFDQPEGNFRGARPEMRQRMQRWHERQHGQGMGGPQGHPQRHPMHRFQGRGGFGPGDMQAPHRGMRGPQRGMMMDRPMVGRGGGEFRPQPRHFLLRERFHRDPGFRRFMMQRPGDHGPMGPRGFERLEGPPRRFGPPGPMMMLERGSGPQRQARPFEGGPRWDRERMGPRRH